MGPWIVRCLVSSVESPCNIVANFLHYTRNRHPKVGTWCRGIGCHFRVLSHIDISLYIDVTWISWYVKSPVIPVFVQPFIQVYIKENIKVLHYWALCEGNPPVTGGFSTQRVSNTENVYMSWQHHVDGLVQDCSNSIANAVDLL